MHGVGLGVEELFNNTIDTCDSERTIFTIRLDICNFILEVRESCTENLGNSWSWKKSGIPIYKCSSVMSMANAYVPIIFAFWRIYA